MEENKDINIVRQERRKKKKSNSFGKFILFLIALVVIALAVFVGTVKIANPNADFSKLPIVQTLKEKSNQVVSYIPGVTQEQTTEATTEPTTEAVTEPTTKEMLDYMGHKQFKFNTARQGNHLGNILNGGKVGTDLTYIYYIVDGKGIYRFAPVTESYSQCYSTDDDLGSINLRGDYIYFVNEDNHKLYKLRKGARKADSIATDVKYAYVYDNTVYYVTTSNALCVMDVKTLTPTTAYYSADEELNFVGISKDRVFFTVTEYDGTVDYLTIDNYAHNRQRPFRKSTNAGEIMSMVMENGYMYYYKLQDDGTYDLCRQKFGSDKVVKLVKEVNQTKQYAIVDSNRVYYAELDDGELKMKEYNMNSKDKRTLISVEGVDKDNPPAIQHGWEYDFIIGDGYYHASCVYTSSTNVMHLSKKNKWKY